jgi:hypothetical protein
MSRATSITCLLLLLLLQDAELGGKGAVSGHHGYTAINDDVLDPWADARSQLRSGNAEVRHARDGMCSCLLCGVAYACRGCLARLNPQHLASCCCCCSFLGMHSTPSCHGKQLSRSHMYQAHSMVRYKLTSATWQVQGCR